MTSRRRRLVLAPAVIALLAVTAACSGSDDGGSEGTEGPRRSTTTVAPSSTTTEAPLSGAPLVVAQQGVSTFPDPFDQTATLGGYAVVLQNPNPDVMATAVHVRTRRSEEHTSELQSLMRHSFHVFFLNTKTISYSPTDNQTTI